MNAVCLASFGPPDVLALAEHRDPEPPAGWVLVELRAAGLNWHDCLLRQGVYAYPLPLIMGADGAGLRRDTGEPVIIVPSLWWGEDERSPSPDFQILGDRVSGTYAELVAVPEENVWPRPSGWDWEQAAAIGLGGTTAYRAMFTRGGLQGGETVAILGAGGGVATIAVALGAMAGARVLVTSSSTEKLDRARQLGAAAGVLYTDADWPEQLTELAGRPGVDLIVDSVGADWPALLGLLNVGGRLVNFGATGGGQATVDLRPFYLGQYSILGTTMGSPRDFREMLALLAERPRWRPTLDTVRPLDQAGAAHAQMERRQHFGKLVLSCT
ncbi:MAG: zinc-binding alcohol dehydrogenase/oxidoreductase, partial [Solirubrobacteraceae bacterium]|jgi:NADPH:quinone reductase-like Zn-dependent oxidoreductase|nr:zinc-binding alcohol dehydrogenase/oxidoreductase [Solirubrobacteraceae bacterium]